MGQIGIPLQIKVIKCDLFNICSENILVLMISDMLHNDWVHVSTFMIIRGFTLDQSCHSAHDLTELLV